MDKASTLAALKGAKPRVKRVDVPGIAEPFYVRSFPSWSRTQFEKENKGEDGKLSDHFRAKLIALTLCNEAGEFLGFTAAEILELSNADDVAMEPLFEAALEVAGMNAKASEQAAKN